MRVENPFANKTQRQRDLHLAPWRLAVGGVTADAALFAAGALDDHPTRGLSR